MQRQLRLCPLPSQIGGEPMAKQKQLPEIPGLDVVKAKRYSRVRLVSLLVGTVWLLARALWFALSGRSAGLRTAARETVPDRRLETPAYIAVVAALSWLTSLPLAYLTGHRVERRFGLTKQSTAGWLTDEAKGLALALALEVPLASGAFAVIRRRPRDWWLILAGATVPLAVVLSNLAPVLIMPLFNKFEPIKDRALAERIKGLAAQAGVKVTDVYVMDMSRQTEKANAFFTGLGNTKRIVLGDTLLERFAPEEVEGVVAHELGHQVHGDIWRLIALGSAFGFAGAFAASRLAPPLIARTARRSGVRELGDVASLPLLALVFSLLGFVAAPIQNAVSRAIERRTDRFALELTNNGAAYAETMKRLAAQNLADPSPPEPVVIFLYSHPPVAERIAAANAYALVHQPAGTTAAEVA